MSEPRISRNPAIMRGQYCIRGTRIPVWTVKSYVAANGVDWALRDYPTLTREDVAAAMAFRVPAQGYRGADGSNHPAGKAQR